MATVNGIAIDSADEALDAASLRARANFELLRQATIVAGLLGADDPPPERGVPTEAASQAVEAFLEQVIRPAAPDEAACRRYYAAHAAQFDRGERVQARHILFATTPGVDVNALRTRAEACLLELRAHTRGEADRFAAAAAQLSNCPSGAQGGALGWLTRADCAPEFARELFGRSEVGVLPRLVLSRFGLHVVEVQARERGRPPSFEDVHDAAWQALQRQAWATAVRQLLHRLAAAADLTDVPLDTENELAVT